jgi:hypothetical protein
MNKVHKNISKVVKKKNKTEIPSNPNEKVIFVSGVPIL